MAAAANHPRRERLAHPYLVVVRGRPGVCFAWTYWGGDRVRWYWVRHDDDASEGAYNGAELHKP
jgi:hypothetical protein